MPQQPQVPHFPQQQEWGQTGHYLNTQLQEQLAVLRGKLGEEKNPEVRVQLAGEISRYEFKLTKQLECRSR